MSLTELWDTPFSKSCADGFRAFFNTNGSAPDSAFEPFSSRADLASFSSKLHLFIFIVLAIGQGVRLFAGVPKAIAWCLGKKDGEAHSIHVGFVLIAHGLESITYFIAAIGGWIILFAYGGSSLLNNIDFLYWFTITLILFVLAISIAAHGRLRAMPASSTGSETIDKFSHSFSRGPALRTLIQVNFITIGILLLLLQQDSYTNGLYQVLAGSFYVIGSQGQLADTSESEGAIISRQTGQYILFFTGSVLMTVAQTNIDNVAFLVGDATRQPYFAFLIIIWIFISTQFLSVCVWSCYSIIVGLGKLGGRSKSASHTKRHGTSARTAGSSSWSNL